MFKGKKFFIDVWLNGKNVSKDYRWRIEVNGGKMSRWINKKIYCLIFCEGLDENYLKA